MRLDSFSHGLSKAVNTTSQLASRPQAQGAFGYSLYVLLLFLPRTSVIPVQITVPNAHHFLESSRMAWFLFQENMGTKCKAKEQTQSKFTPSPRFIPSHRYYTRAGSNSLCCPTHTHTVGEGHPKTTSSYPPHRQPLRNPYTIFGHKALACS